MEANPQDDNYHVEHGVGHVIFMLGELIGSLLALQGTLNPEPEGADYDRFCHYEKRMYLCKILIDVQLGRVVSNYRSILYVQKNKDNPFRYSKSDEVQKAVKAIARKIGVARIVLVPDAASNAVIYASPRTLYIKYFENENETEILPQGLC